MEAERGALLLECLVSVMILGVAVTMLLNLLAVGYLAQALARDQSLATSLAQRRLEEMREAGPQAVVSDPRRPVDEAAYRRFEWEVHVANGSANLKEVTAIVYWTARGRERSVQLATYLRGR